MKSNNNENITEVNEHTFRGTECPNCRCIISNDVSEYKWELVSDNQNEATKVHFYKEDMKDKVSVSLSNIFDVWLRNYENHLCITENEERIRLETEERRGQDDLFDEKLDELVDSYELSLFQSVKEELYKQDIRPNISNIKKILREIIHYEDNANIVRSCTSDNSEEVIFMNLLVDDPNHQKKDFFTHMKWLVENEDKINELCSIKGIHHNPHFDPNERSNENGFYKNVVLRNLCMHLRDKMLKSKIDYWFPKK